MNRSVRLLVAALALPAGAGAQQTSLFPAIEPNRTGELRVSDRHTLYWETSGNEQGIPVIVLHGGPGGRSSPVMRRIFDPVKYRIIQFDQRGSGRSRPFAEWRENDLSALIADIRALRGELGIAEPAVLFGLSWGTTVSLAYAQEHPTEVAGLVLLGVFTCRKSEIDHYYHGGVAPFYPEAANLLRSIVPHPDRTDYPRQLFEVVTGADSTNAARAVEAFATYEEWLSTVGGTREAAREEASDPVSRSLAVLENHYLMNGCFLREGQLLENAHRLNGIPVFVGNGRLDMITPPGTAQLLATRIPGARLEIVTGNGHVDLGVALAGVRGAEWVAGQVDRGRE